MTTAGTVLVVEDNPEFLDVVRTILREPALGFAVAGAATGTAALEFLEGRPPFAGAPRPAFVVLDFRLPDMNAPAVLRRMAASETLQPLPVLVLSQAHWDADRAAALAAGATAFRVKPSRVQQLREILVEFRTLHVEPV